MTTSLKLKLTALFATIASVLAACLVATPVAQASASGGCNPPGSTTIAQDAVGRFYVSGQSSNPSGWYVCAFKQGTPRIVATSHPDRPTPDDASAKVSGRYLALAFAGGNRCCGAVTVIDMTDGHQVFSGDPEAGQNPISFGFHVVATLVLELDGSVAWIIQGSGGIWYVHRHDFTGTAIVDSGSDIDPYSLAAGGSWLYWTDAGSPRSAPFH